MRIFAPTRTASLLLALLSCAGLAGCPAVDEDSGESETVEVTDYAAPRDDDALLADDRIGDKAPKFDPGRVDRRPEGDWQVNLSDSVLRLDVPIVMPDRETYLTALHANYAAAAKSLPTIPALLPSVNMIDGKAKQFDDGLYAALEQAYYRGELSAVPGPVGFLRRLFAKVGPDSPAAPFLAAGLDLAGEHVAVKDEKRRGEWLVEFEGNPSASKPIAFYTWNPTLRACFRVLRYFQHEFRPNDPELRPLAAAISGDPALRADYETSLAFYAKLSNPQADGSVLDAPGDGKAGRRFCLFPASTSRETELFVKLFPDGVPRDANLMRELIARVRSGEVDLKPKPNGGWYDRQVHALETLLLPDRGAEAPHLLLTRTYKKRMLEAFKALMTKRRETHSRQLKTAAPAATAAAPLKAYRPRLRLEPNPTFYLRTARSYAFLAAFLDSAVGEPALASLHGLREDKPQAADLRAELHAARDLFYGCYLLSAEDLGMAVELADDEPVDRAACEKAAADWLARPFDDPDMKRDTRVAVPSYLDPQRGVVRLWTTLGVRPTKLDANYARPPRVRPADGSKDWEALTPGQLRGESYFILVDEFAEVEAPIRKIPNREELRAVCDRLKNKEAILRELSR